MIRLLISAFFLAVCTRFADKSRWIKANIWHTGMFFGFLSLLANAGSFHAEDVNAVVGIQDVPIILAAFFFGPLEGIISGIIAFFIHELALVIGVVNLPAGTAVSMLVVASYAAAIKQWVFEKKRPLVIPAAALAFFGEIAHQAFIFMIGVFSNQDARMLEILSATYPMVPVIAAVTAGCTAILFGLWESWKKNFYTSLIIGLLFIWISFLLIQTTMISTAGKRTQSAILTGVHKLAVQIEEQIDYGLHGKAASIMKYLKEPGKYKREKLQQYADLTGIDEINIFTGDGKLLASNRQAVLENNQQVRDPGALQAFMKLTAGKQNIVKQHFRASRSEPSVYAKYIGIPFPDRKAFLQLGFSYERMLSEFSVYFFPIFNKATIGESGFFIVTDRTGKIAAPIAGHEDAAGKQITKIETSIKNWDIPIHQFCEARFFGKYGQCYRCRDLGPWRIYAYLPYAEFFTDAVTLICFYGFILLGLCIGFRLVLVHIVRAQKKIDDMRAADLELAGTIQNSELPEKTFENKFCRIQASMTPAKEVGGDFYDHYELADGRIVVTAADVSGKGIPAAIFMMKAKNILNSLIPHETDLAVSMQKANNKLNQHNEAAMFVTAWVGIFNPADGMLEYVSAGHNPPLILRHDGNPEWLNKDKRQKPLAAFVNTVYQTHSVQLQPEDTLFLYTDGVTEAANIRQELYGSERLENVLRQADGRLIETVTESLKKFTADAPVADDITILTLEVKK